jgi:hypothetical protein
VSVSVNISSVQASDPTLVDQIGEALCDSGLEPRRLVLELTEGIAMANPTAITTLLMELRAMGVRISVDDFGTGYSSLAYLRQFPIDTLKIDRSFVRGMVTNKDTAEIVAGLMNMAQQLGLHVVAEGIEHEDQCAQLLALKCHAGQGNLFGTPLDVDRAAEVLKNGLPPRPVTNDAAASSRRHVRIPQLLVRGRTLVARQRVSFAVAALALASAGLVIMIGSQPARGASSMSLKEEQQQLPIAAHVVPAAPIVPAATVVEMPRETPASPVTAAPVTKTPATAEKERPKGRGAAGLVPVVPASGAPTLPPPVPASAEPAHAAPAHSASTAGSPSPGAAAAPSAMQATSVNVIHLHRLGNCRGRFDATADGVAFVSDSDDADEAFTLKYTEFLAALSDDTLIVRSATKTYRFKAVAGSESKAQLRDLAERISRSRR